MSIIVPGPKPVGYYQRSKRCHFCGSLNSPKLWIGAQDGVEYVEWICASFRECEGRLTRRLNKEG